MARGARPRERTTIHITPAMDFPKGAHIMIGDEHLRVIRSDGCELTVTGWRWWHTARGLLDRIVWRVRYKVGCAWDRLYLWFTSEGSRG